MIRLSLPPDAVSDTQDFDGTEFEILPDGEVRAAEKYAIIDKDEVYELKELIL